MNFKETFVPGFHVKRWPGYLNFQVNYGKALLPCSRFCAGRIILQLLIPKYYFDDKLPKMTDIPPVAKTSPCDDSLILWNIFLLCRKMQTYVECLLMHPCISTWHGRSGLLVVSLEGPVCFTTNYPRPDKFSIWEQSTEKGELSCLREDGLNNACVKHCSFRLWAASWCNLIHCISICKARRFLFTLCFGIRMNTHICMGTRPSVSYGIFVACVVHKVMLNKAPLLAWKKNKNLQNLSEMLQKSCEATGRTPCASREQLHAVNSKCPTSS